MNSSLTTGSCVRVMIVEDHPDYREVVEIALRKESGIELVGTFGVTEVALRSLKSCEPSEFPNVILLDINLPGQNGLDAIPDFQAAIPNVKIIVLTQSNMEEDVIRAIGLGAAGYLLKSTRVDKIVEGIGNVMKGEASLDSSVAKFVLEKLQSVLPSQSKNRILTPREYEVLELLAEGLTKKQIAAQLTVSTSTVSTHVVHIFEKLNVQNAPSAIAQAFRLGLFPER